jgi:hypothetical protein
MSNRQPSHVKFMLGLLAITSIASIMPGVQAQTVDPDTNGSPSNGILQRANLKLDSSQYQQGSNTSPSLEQLSTPSKLDRVSDSVNSGCVNTACRKPLKDFNSNVNPGLYQR